MVNNDHLRGIRDNNPGNIDKGQPWQGLAESQDDPRFCTFVSPEYGIRAIHIILQSYARKYGLRTVAGIIGRWAPPTENDTASYVKHVAALVGVGPEEAIDIMNSNTAFWLVTAIIAHENAGYQYPEEIVWSGLEKAGVKLA